MSHCACLCSCTSATGNQNQTSLRRFSRWVTIILFMSQFVIPSVCLFAIEEALLSNPVSEQFNVELCYVSFSTWMHCHVHFWDCIMNQITVKIHSIFLFAAFYSILEKKFLWFQSSPDCNHHKQLWQLNWESSTHQQWQTYHKRMRGSNTWTVLLQELLNPKTKWLSGKVKFHSSNGSRVVQKACSWKCIQPTFYLYDRGPCSMCREATLSAVRPRNWLTRL